jgi:hypothetical protein
MRPREGNAIVLAIAAATAAAGILLHASLGPPGTSWTVDDAGKALVLERVSRDPSAPWLPYAGAALDPEYALFPQPLGGSEPYAVRRGGRVLSQYHAPFIWLSVLPYEALGDTGLAIWPALGAGGAVFLTGRWAAGLAGPMAGLIASLLALCASPLPFYAAVFWEHTLTIALAAGGFLALSSRRPGTAGLALGGAALLREEMALLVAAAVAVAFAQRHGRAALRLALGGAAGVWARAAFHVATTGSWLGVHAELNRSEPFRHVVEAANGLLFGTGFSGLPGASAFVAVAALALSRALPPARSRHVLIAGVAALVAVAVLGFLSFPGDADRALALVRSNSAALFLPWTLVAPFLRTTTTPSMRPAAWTALLFLALFVLLVPERSITGVHPGPRMLLPLLPIACVLAASGMASSRRAVVLLAPLVLTAMAWNVRSLGLLHSKRETAGRLAAAILAEPERIVVTDLFWLPTEMGVLWDRKQFHLLRRDADLELLVERAAAAGERSVLAAVEPGRIPAEPLARIQHPDLPAFSVDVHRLVLRPEPAPGDTATIRESSP